MFWWTFPTKIDIFFHFSLGAELFILVPWWSSHVVDTQRRYCRQKGTQDCRRVWGVLTPSVFLCLHVFSKCAPSLHQPQGNSRKPYSTWTCSKYAVCATVALLITTCLYRWPWPNRWCFEEMAQLTNGKPHFFWRILLIFMCVGKKQARRTKPEGAMHEKIWKRKRQRYRIWHC